MDWKKDLVKFKLFKKPRKSSSKNSASLYFGIKDTKNKTQILQYLPPNSKTSKHHHKSLLEKYYILSGKCYLSIKQRKRTLKNGERINKGESHQLETKKEGCLILLEIYHAGAKDWKKDK